MNWKLCLLLSIAGLIMGVVTIDIVSSTIEPICWLIIFAASAVLVARFAPQRYFLHGFLISILNSVWITLAHLSRYNAYTAAHPEFLQSVQSLPPLLANDPQRLMVLIGVIAGILSGVVLGFFCWLASKIVKPKMPNW